MKWEHDQLASDLANRLRGNTDAIVWENMQMGPSGSPRPDCYRIAKSYTKFQPIAYEIKVSVADFRRDITAGKWQSYLKFASGVVFAVPAGLINKADIPAGCGLMVRGEDGWRSLKAPTLQRLETLPREAWLKLMIDGIQRENERSQRTRNRGFHFAHQDLSKKFGTRIAGLVYDLERAEGNLEAAITEARQKADEIRSDSSRAVDMAVGIKLGRERKALEDFKFAHASLIRSLGLPPEADTLAVSKAVTDAAYRLANDNELVELRGTIKQIKRLLDKADKPLPGEVAA